MVNAKRNVIEILKRKSTVNIRKVSYIPDRPGIRQELCMIFVEYTDRFRQKPTNMPIIGLN